MFYVTLDVNVNDCQPLFFLKAAKGRATKVG